jgi:hypothetical protein
VTVNGFKGILLVRISKSTKPPLLLDAYMDVGSRAMQE